MEVSGTTELSSVGAAATRILMLKQSINPEDHLGITDLERKL